MDENPLSKRMEDSLNDIEIIARENGQAFAGLAIFGFKTDEDDVLDQTTVSVSYTQDLPRETQRAMLKIAHKLIGSMLGD